MTEVKLHRWKRIMRCRAGRLYRSGGVTVFIGGHDED